MNYLSHHQNVLFERMFLKYPSLLDEIRNEIYTVADTGFSSRNILTLDKAGLLPNRRQSNSQWRKFNLNDLLFIEIVKKCREFNMDSAQLVQLKKLFYEDTKNFIKVGEVTPTEQALVPMLTGEVPLSIQIYSNGMVIISDNYSIDSDIGASSLFIDLNNIFDSKIEQFKSLNEFSAKYDLEEFKGDYLLKTLGLQSKWLLKVIQGNDYSKIAIIKKHDGRLVIEGEKTKEGNKLTLEDIEKIEKDKSFGKVE